MSRKWLYLIVPGAPNRPKPAGIVSCLKSTRTKMAENSTEDLPERITVLAKDFTPAAMEFHRRNMSEKGYRMEGQIVSRQFQMIEGMGAPTNLFEGTEYYAVTFVRKSAEG